VLGGWLGTEVFTGLTGLAKKLGLVT
jgi:hypothetical protein